MAKYKPIDMMQHYQGKICEHSDTYFAKKKKTLYTGRICNPRNLEQKPYSEKELQTHNKFKQAREAVKALTEEQIEQYKVDFENHLKAPNPKYSYLSGYIFAQEYKKLNN